MIIILKVVFWDNYFQLLTISFAIAFILLIIHLMFMVAFDHIDFFSYQMAFLVYSQYFIILMDSYSNLRKSSMYRLVYVSELLFHWIFCNNGGIAQKKIMLIFPLGSETFIKFHRYKNFGSYYLSYLEAEIIILTFLFQEISIINLLN